MQLSLGTRTIWSLMFCKTISMSRWIRGERCIISMPRSKIASILSTVRMSVLHTNTSRPIKHATNASPAHTQQSISTEPCRLVFPSRLSRMHAFGLIEEFSWLYNE